MAYNQIGKGAPVGAPYLPNQTPPRGKIRMPREVHVPYVPVYWPSWRYDPDTGEGQIFEKEEDVPEGWLDNPALAGMSDAEIEEVDAARLAPVTSGDDDGKDDGPTLASLEVTRDEAMELLTEEGVDFPKNIPSAKLAALLADILDTDEKDDDAS